VRSTRIFCRPVCPAPAPKAQNIVYFPSAAAAAAAGFRPCLRCRPELAPGTRPADSRLGMALSLIGEGWLQESSVEALAARVALSPRHLRRLFIERLGATPLQVHQTQRFLLAKQLLSESTLPVTQVALAAGFSSVRRFNDAFKASCGAAPTAVRRRTASQPAGELILRLAYRPPLDFPATLARLRTCAIPGVERVTRECYERTIGEPSATGWIRITSSPDKPELRLHAFNVEPTDVQALVRRARRMFDLDADMRSVHAMLQHDLGLARSIRRYPGLRLAGAWDGFEAAVGEVLRSTESDDVRVRAAMGRIVQRWGSHRVVAPPGLERCFPSPTCLAQARLEEHTGIAPAIANVIRRLAQVVDDGALNFRAGQVLEDFAARFVALTGAVPGCAQAVALRTMGDPDAFPVESCAPAALLDDWRSASPRWRPWRAYALALLAQDLRSGAGGRGLDQRQGALLIGESCDPISAGAFPHSLGRKGK